MSVGSAGARRDLRRMAGGRRHRVTGGSRGFVGVLGALAAGVAALAACGVDGSFDRPGPATPGARLEGDGLPVPVSNLVALDPLVTYYAAGPDAELELVAVDPDRAEVVWTVPARVSEQPRGVSIGLARVPGGVAILAPRPDGIDSFRLQVIGVDGQVRWDRPVSHPQKMPTRCGDRICVDEARGPVAFDAIDAGREPGAPLPDQAQVVGTTDDEVLAVTPQDDPQLPARTVQARPRFGTTRGGWERPVSRLFGGAEVTSYQGWSGQQYGGTWVLWLGAVSELAEDEVPTFPYVEPAGSVAGFASEDGAPRWHREATSVCGPLSSDRVLVLCESTLTYPSASGKGRKVIEALERVDPVSGETDFTVALDEPIDLFDADERLVALGEDRWLLRDGTEVFRVDLRNGRRAPADEDTVGWCASNDETEPLRYPWTDEPETYAGPGFLHPCRLDAGATDAELAAPIVDGRLSQPEGWTVATVGRWRLWLEDGTLTGVVTEG